jgi:hypothetical protein
MLHILTNDIIEPNLKCQSFEGATDSNVTPEALSTSIIQLFQQNAVQNNMTKSAVRHMEGLLYIIMRNQRGSADYDYGPQQGKTLRIINKAGVEGEKMLVKINE